MPAIRQTDEISTVQPAHFPEKLLKRRLYLGLRQPGKFGVPENVEIPQPKARPEIPVLAD